MCLNLLASHFVELQLVERGSFKKAENCEALTLSFLFFVLLSLERETRKERKGGNFVGSKL